MWQLDAIGTHLKYLKSQVMSRDVKGCQGAGVRLNMGVWLACAWYFGSLERGPCGWSAVRDMLHMLAYAQL